MTQLATRPDNALLLGLEGYRSSATPEAANAVVDALEAVRLSGATAILRGGQDGVRTIAVSRDGSTLAAADFDGTVRLFDLRERKPLGDPFRAHTAEVWGLAFSPDGQDPCLLELRRHGPLLARRRPEPGRRAHRPGHRELC